ncbi:MAG: WYL domain-containing protein [Bacteroidetes bacterium]|nr:WYL domain-containing protein [Bacteroidota bacterium]
MEHLSTVYTAIIEQLPLQISYKPFLGEVTNFGFSSYLLKEYNNRWFVFGIKDGEKTITNLAIDRIGSISKPTTPFTFNQHFNPEDYFHDIIGVTKLENKDKIEIQLRFTVKRGQYVKSKPLHHSQKIIKENTKSLLLQIDVIPNYELMSVILSFGSDVEVVGPKSYRKEIADAIQRAAQVY